MPYLCTKVSYDNKIKNLLRKGQNQDFFIFNLVITSKWRAGLSLNKCILLNPQLIMNDEL